ncbi:MAG: hypothetical protein MRY83_16245, partial [Flavobacteriales bacterium]|nr:hypothetical protein [Flavobacteriales bacterium]
MTRIIILILLIIGIISCEVKNSRPTNQSNRKSFEEELYITPYKTDTMINDSIRMIVNVIASENDFIEDTFNLFRYIGGSLELEVYNVNYKITSQVID